MGDQPPPTATDVAGFEVDAGRQAQMSSPSFVIFQHTPRYLWKIYIRALTQAGCEIPHALPGRTEFSFEDASDK